MGIAPMTAKHAAEANLSRYAVDLRLGQPQQVFDFYSGSPE